MHENFDRCPLIFYWEIFFRACIAKNWHPPIHTATNQLNASTYLSSIYYILRDAQLSFGCWMDFMLILHSSCGVQVAVVVPVTWNLPPNETGLRRFTFWSGAQTGTVVVVRLDCIAQIGKPYLRERERSRQQQQYINDQHATTVVSRGSIRK